MKERGTGVRALWAGSRRRLPRAGGARVGPQPAPTSLVVFAVRAQGLHGHVAARASPAGLADAMPAVLVQGTSAVAVTQPGAALCGEDQEGQGLDDGRLRPAERQIEDTGWGQAFRKSRHTVIAHG